MQTVEIEKRAGAAWVWMNRAERHNAFDEGLIAELADCLARLDADPSVTAIVLAGRGRSFSAGADLDWMKRQGEASPEDNEADARRLGRLFETLAQCRPTTIARVHGAAIGGGLGLAAACDICLASTRAVFATSEVRLGLIPAVISPYVIRAIGERACLRYFQTAERIDAARACDLGLVHDIVEPDALDDALAAMLTALGNAGPLARAASKDLIRAVSGRTLDATLTEETARRIAVARATDEAREGLSAFLEKREPRWAAG